MGGGIAKDNRLFINAVFWILRTGAPWRDLPPDYGGWSNTHRRFIRWRDQGIWEKRLEILIDEPDYEWLMIDASHCKVHPHAASAKGGNQAMSRTQGGSTPRYTWPWMRRVCRSECLCTPGTTTDCTQASKLIEGMDADHLIADRDYDTDAILQQAATQGMHAVIPPKKNRTVQRKYDQDLYKLHPLIENAFLALKPWWAIVTRYAKNSASFLAAVHIRCLVLWLKIS